MSVRNHDAPGAAEAGANTNVNTGNGAAGTAPAGATGAGAPNASPSGLPLNPAARKNLFSFASRRAADPPESPYALSPVGVSTKRLLQSPRKAPRKIPRIPFKV